MDKAKAQKKADPVEEQVQALRDLANQVVQGGWDPDPATASEIKAAIAGRDQKEIAKVMINLQKLSKAALQINNDTVQGELIDA